jgi:hypothetical protein
MAAIRPFIGIFTDAHAVHHSDCAMNKIFLPGVPAKEILAA